MLARTTRTGKLILLAGIIASCVSCDQATKLLATYRLRLSGPVSVLGDTIRLTYAENVGGFLSLGSQLGTGTRQLLFVVLVPAALLMLAIHILRSHAVEPTDTVASALVIGGGIGNLIDRVAFGFVRDFANLGFGQIRTGVFNVADVAITVGALLLVASAAHVKFRAWRAG